MSSSQNCTETANAGANMPICGYIYEDVNGFNGPNTCGKDIYLVWVTENGLIPAGYYKDNKGIVSCQQGANGLGCSLLYLEQ